MDQIIVSAPPAPRPHLDDHHPLDRPARPRTPAGLLAQAGRDAAYLLLSWPLLTAGFVTVLTLVTVGAGLAVIGIGVPVLLAGLSVARTLAVLDRQAAQGLTGDPAPPVTYPSDDPSGGTVARLLRPLADRRRWLDVQWVLLAFPLSTLTFSLALLWVAGALGTVLGPLTTLLLTPVLGEDRSGLAHLLGLPFPLLSDVVLQLGVGMAFLVTAPAVLRTLARAQAGLGSTLGATR